jgi:uncharacterized protein (TIGR02246 family)
MSAETVRSAAGAVARRLPSAFAPLLLVAALLAAVPLAARADHVRPVPSGPAAVVAAYAAAVNAGDLGAILALYADDAVHVALPAAEGSGVRVGKEQFRLFYEQGIANGDRVEVVAGTLAVAGDRVAFVARLASEPWRALGIEQLEANAEAVVQGGRITTHVVMLTPGSARALLTARGAIPGAPAGDAPEAVQRPHGPH